MNNNDYCKKLTLDSLQHSFDEIMSDYSDIYDEYNNNNEADRDIYFLHDLVDAIKSINTVLYVYNRDKYIHPSYALEKLNYGKSIFEMTMKYYEDKLKEGNSDEEN